MTGPQSTPDTPPLLGVLGVHPVAVRVAGVAETAPETEREVEGAERGAGTRGADPLTLTLCEVAQRPLKHALRLD